MTKPVTGVALMMLYEEGKWRLDDPVSNYIPEFSKLNVFAGENADGSMKLEPARRPMTMRELMTHSAGLGYVLNQNNPVDRLIIQKEVLNPGASLQHMVEKLATVPLMAQPGTRWYYSIAVDVQGYLVEKLSGQPFAGVSPDPSVRTAGDAGHGVLRSQGKAGPAGRGAWRRRRWTVERLPPRRAAASR